MSLGDTSFGDTLLRVFGGPLGPVGSNQYGVYRYQTGDTPGLLGDPVSLQLGLCAGTSMSGGGSASKGSGGDGYYGAIGYWGGSPQDGLE